jgi:hypothetical protein
VIFAITIMSVIAVVALNTAADERRASRATRESSLAMYAAEAGLRQTYGSWPVAPVKALTPGDSLDLGWVNLPNKAAYRAVIHRVDKGGLQEYNVVVQGRRTDPTAGIITLVGSVGGVPGFKYGVSAQNSIALSGPAVVDGFDSEVAPYSAASPDNANLWSNGTVNMTNTSTVKGDVTAATSITRTAGTTITGASTQGVAAAAPMDINACPAGGFTASARIPVGPGVSYSSFSGVLFVYSGATLTLTDTSYYLSSIVLSGGAKLAVPGTQHVSVILRDSLNSSAGTVNNPSLKSTDLSLSSCGTSATPAPWTLAGGAQSYFSVYAPNHAVSVVGGGDIYGGVVSSSFSANGAKLHYDAALARQSSSKLVVQQGSWAQLPGS